MIGVWRAFWDAYLMPTGQIHFPWWPRDLLYWILVGHKPIYW